MSHVIVAIIFFALGSLFGLGWMALLSAGKQADKEMEEHFRQEVKSHES